jgi:hypothetical protein
MLDQNTKREIKKMPKKSDISLSPLPNTSLPKEVLVLGAPFQVEVKKVDSDIFGETDGLKKIITVSSSLLPSEQWQVFLHEWAHAVLYVNGVASVIDDAVEEIIAQSLEHALVELLSQMVEIWKQD